MDNWEVEQENDLLTVILLLSPSIGIAIEPSAGNPTFFSSLDFVEGFFNSGSVFSPLGATQNNFLLHLDPDVSILEKTITELGDFLNAGWSEPPPPQKNITSRKSNDVEGFANSVVETTGTEETLPGLVSKSSHIPSVGTTPKEEEENGSPRKKRQNKCLEPSGGNLNMVCGVNVAIEEVEDMDDWVIVRKIHGRHPNLEEMKGWVQTNWTDLLSSAAEVGDL